MDVEHARIRWKASVVKGVKRGRLRRKEPVCRGQYLSSYMIAPLFDKRTSQYLSLSKKIKELAAFLKFPFYKLCKILLVLFYQYTMMSLYPRNIKYCRTAMSISNAFQDRTQHTRELFSLIYSLKYITKRWQWYWHR